ncbi:MAG: DCC1-like thiol-disulfide oxidoreductase family protein, partial [Chloroflexota bacterium]|nr:DCC1-like thiol-disulfide oxidoreductase family protein [Chloroflexota bacterium]
MPADPQQQILLYDGVCALCNGTVRFVIKRDPGGSMRFAPLQGAYATALLERHPGLAGVDSLVLVTLQGGRERIDVRSDAALRVAEYLGGGWRVAAGLRLVPRPLRDAV